MVKLISLITNNPAVLGYIALACFVCGLGAGAYPAWKYESALKDAVQARYDSFVGQTKAAGVAAEKIAAAKEAEDKANKESTDAQIKDMEAGLADLSTRLYNARASRGYLPKARPGAKQPDRVCFSRSKFESAMGYIDAEGTRLVKLGDLAGIGLYNACIWSKKR